METETINQWDNGLFVQSQEDLTEEINLRLFVKPKIDKINKQMSKFLEGLK